MTGIVVVSHSRALAEAAVALAGEMVPPGTIPVEVAAGLDDGSFGTDATAITTAIEAADDGVGVVVLMDLGSAVMSAELALDLIDPGLRERVVLCAAPLVEGLVVAAVSAAGGADPAVVADEASSALLAKQNQLGVEPVVTPAPDAGEAPASVDGDAAVVAEVVVGNPHGLHARPAARLVTEVSRFDAQVSLRNLTTSSGPVSGRSLSRVATLGAEQGHRVEVSATGPGAADAVAAVVALAERDFDDVPGPSTGSTRPAAARGGGPLPASPGVGVGPAHQLATVQVEVPDEQSAGAEQEWARLQAALAEVRAETEQVRADAARVSGADEAAIFDAHLLLLSDDDLLAGIRGRIDAGAAATRAWADGADELAARFEALDDPYLRERAADVRAVGGAVLRALVGETTQDVALEGVVIADDLTPAQVSRLDPSRVAGIVLAGGSPTGHSAILAKARGIPAVVSAGPAVLAIPDGTTVALDGGAGELVVDPDTATLDAFAARAAEQGERAAAALGAAAEPAVSVDGVEVIVAANVGSVDDAEAGSAGGADGSGLVRTEFLFLGRDDAPGVDEQVAVYRSIAAALGGRRITLRTLDVGGDKPLPYAPQSPEANPFLGVRGIRLALAQESLLRDQFEAIVRVAHETPVSVMFPMVSVVDELLEARRRLDDAVEVVGRGRPEGLEVGIMVEVPSAALKAAAFVPHVDFFSIGTNDLTQYTMAAERGNAAVASLADALDPGVLSLIGAVCDAAAGGPLVAVCGELAGDVAAIGLLLALGVRELSMAPRSIPAAKEAVRQASVDASADLVKAALGAASAAEVRALLAGQPASVEPGMNR